METAMLCLLCFAAGYLIAINENESFNIEEWEEGYEKGVEDAYEFIRHNTNKG